ncbi:MAG: UDP-N-acetylglucosamine 1-carboxyvinyltransferase [Defluviitaleaceae bacterium]|nr:UDP-N-acetylglucosamine 1-carboxyvinyltransferase [Defluviitaleaceae bacterium]
MEYIAISGNNPLKGSVEISGAKNSAVAIIPAALLVGGICVIENLPVIEDVSNYITVLESIGVKCRYINPHALEIDARNIHTTSIAPDNLKNMRASYYLIGALLGRFRSAAVPMPGGCNFGARPIDLHVKGFEQLGAAVVQEHGAVRAEAESLVGTQIYLDVASVGATINIMMAAIYAEGTTIIENAAKEPHIVDCANFLNRCGANIKGAGTGVIRITGVQKLKGCTYAIIPDQIEAGTYMIAGAITGGSVTVRNVIPKHMEALSAKLSEVGCTVTAGDDWLKVTSNGKFNSCSLMTLYYPGFPTDLQPQMTALLTQAEGVSTVTEAVFDNRFQYVDHLMRLGVDIKIEGRTAIVRGPSHLTGTDVVATDLRAGAALIMAALVSKGVTRISNVHYIDRGYEKIEEKLRSLGANIRRVHEGDAPALMEA